MFVEYAGGSDSFPMGGRNVQVNALVYNPKTALFENPRSIEGADAVVRGAKVVQGIPATTVSVNSQSMWYYYRCEAMSGSLWLIHLRRKDGGPFTFHNEYLLVRMSAKASLIRAELILPPHEEANVQKLEFSWNARRISTYDQLIPDERNAFKKFLGESGPDEMIDVTQTRDELSSWRFSMLEEQEKPKRRLVRSGRKALAVQRIKKIRI